METFLTLLFGMILGTAITYCVWKRKQKKGSSGAFGSEQTVDEHRKPGRVD